MRQIVLDTETTGIGHEHGHRIIEIACVELIDRRLTGNHFHCYVNPGRTIDAEAFKVHGISNDFLRDKPPFKAIMDEFICFVDKAELIIHNAPFDVGFINAEFKHARYASIIETHCTILDTLVLAKQKHPGQRNNLDALCKRYSVDNSSREWHGALLDAELLAFVYLAMTGGQTSLFSDHIEEIMPVVAQSGQEKKRIDTVDLSVIYANTEEVLAHEAFMAMLADR